ncbi:MAG: OmpH family outer membrane protein [Paracoccaceae bacterium]
MPDALRAVMFAVVGLWVMPQLSMAQQTAPPAAPSETTAPVASPRSPVLTITQDRLFSGTLYGQAVQARIEAASQALQAENRKIEADLEAEESNLTTRRATLPPAEFRALADAFDTKVEGIRTAQDAKARALAKSQEQGRQLFFDTAVPILAALMAELGAVAILNKEAIVLSFDTIDITDRAIVRIDAVLGDGSKLPPAP